MKELQALTAMEYVRHWQGPLRLGDWRITVSLREPQGTRVAEAHWDKEVRDAILTFKADTPASLLEREVVHELAHLLLASGEELACEVIADLTTKTQRGYWGEADIFSEAFPPGGPLV